MAARAGIRKPGLLAWASLALTLGISGWVMWESQRMMRADMVSVAARQDIQRWAAGIDAPASRADWASALQAIERAISLVPDNPVFHDSHAEAHMVAGTQEWFEPEVRREHFQKAIQSYRASLNLRPTEAQAWAGLASAYFAAGELGAPLHQAWARALQLGPHEGHVQPVLMDIALATWKTATPEMRAWVETTFENTSDAGRDEINRMAASRGLRLTSTAPASAPLAAEPRP